MSLPDYLKDTAKDFAKQLTASTAVPIKTSAFTGRQFVAGEDPLQTQAINLARAGVGSFQPFLQAAQTAVGQQAGLTGPQAFQQFMSPFQQQVIDTTLQDFDRQAAMGRQNIRDQAVTAGAFGGGREGVAQGELERARLSQIGLAQQAGFQQALGAAQRQQQLGLQSGQLLGALGGQQQALRLQDIQTGLQAGGVERGIGQAGLEAARQTQLQRSFEPFQRIEFLKGILTNLPTTQSSITATTAPGSNPVSQALGAGLGAYSTYQFMQPRR